MPLDALTAARLARDGEKAGPIRHMCSGQHAVSLLLSRLKGWDIETYWQREHPSQVAYRLGGRPCVRHGMRHSRRPSTGAASRHMRSRSATSPRPMRSWPIPPRFRSGISVARSRPP